MVAQLVTPNQCALSDGIARAHSVNAVTEWPSLWQLLMVAPGRGRDAREDPEAEGCSSPLAVSMSFAVTRKVLPFLELT